MENKPMVYTAIFQSGQGQLTQSKYTGYISRKDAWLSAAKMGASEGNCLIALVPGDHPVYFYDNFVKDTSSDDRSEMQRHDLYDMS